MKNERRRTEVRQSKFFAKALENAIKNQFLINKTSFIFFTEQSLFFILFSFKGVKNEFVFALSNPPFMGGLFCFYEKNSKIPVDNTDIM